MEKYIEAINNISSYEIWHECTYDDGYSNFDDWIEYPFEDDENIKLLSGLITKHDNLNKGIDELINEYQTILNSLNKYQTQRFNHTQQIKIDLIKEFIEKLKKLKGE